MKRSHSFLGMLSLAFVLSAQALVGCGPSKATLTNPDKVAAGDGIAFGRVRLFRDENELTGSCKLQFEDADENLTGTYNLDKDGWVFATLPQGHNSLYFVRCAVMFGLFQGFEDLHFEVPGEGKSVYLGDLEIRLSEDEEKAKKTIADAEKLSGLMTVATLQGTAVVVHDEDDFVLINNRLDEASREYEARFGEKPNVIVEAGTSVEAQSE